MKTFSEIYTSIKNLFESSVKDTTEKGSVLDMFMLSVSHGLADAHQAIEDAKDPHIYTKLNGQNLDDMVKFCGFERRAGESDANLLYRLINWATINEKSNTIAIDAALLDLEYASNVTYVPMVYGTGTAICYVIPNSYDTNTIELALSEAKDRLQNVVSPSLYIEYVTPELRAVTLTVNIQVQDASLADVQRNLELQIADYVNAIAPNNYIDIGAINRMGVNEQGVSYFNVVGLFIDGVSVTSTKVLQNIKTKLLLDEINWIEVS